jgi:L-aminopeptidase/D-esterase-like protein
MTRRDLLSMAAASPALFAAAADPNDWLAPGGTLTDVPGIKVGHCTLKTRPTGCTVILCEDGATAGVDVRGAAPGTRETDLLNPVNTVQQVQAVILSGGSAYGLDTATGVMRYLEGKGKGYQIAGGVVPIVPAAILFDLGVGDFKIRPNADSGYQACMDATSKPVPQGNVGAGAGATIGKMFGPQFAMKAGIGSASIRVGDTGLVVGAIVAVNAVGDIVNPRNGQIVAGARTEDGKGFRDTVAQIMRGYRVVAQAGVNTTIGLVATNAVLDKAQATKVAQMAQDGLARAIRPVHTPADGDTVFALATGSAKSIRVNHGQIGVLAAEAMAQAIVRAAVNSSTVLGFPGIQDWKK